MIGVMLQGGLGNQLFQYALGRHLAKIHNTSLAFDLRLLRNPKVVTARKYSLGHFQVAGTPMTEEQERLCGSWYSPNRLFAFDKFLTISHERSSTFDPMILGLPDNSCIQGYFQSEKYFSAISEILHKEIALLKPLENSEPELLEQISSSNSIIVHIRRGDYVNNRHLPLCNESYYHAGISMACERLEDCRVFIFSDDIPWCREHIVPAAPTTYVERKAKDEAHIELALMHYGKAFVIANSSFSWWGAWLAKTEPKIVIAPKQWFNPKYLSDRDIVPSQWLRI